MKLVEMQRFNVAYIEAILQENTDEEVHEQAEAILVTLREDDKAEEAKRREKISAEVTPCKKSHGTSTPVGAVRGHKVGTKGTQQDQQE